MNISEVMSFVQNFTFVMTTTMATVLDSHHKFNNKNPIQNESSFLSMSSSLLSSSIRTMDGILDQIGQVHHYHHHPHNHLSHHLHHRSFHKTGRLSLPTYLTTTILLCLTTMLSAPGNLLIIWVVIKTPFLRLKAVNMLIVNLCFIDLLASCFDLPLSWLILQLNFNNVRYHPLLCKIQLFVHTMSISGQIFSFVSVGYERFHTVSKPFDKEKVRKITHILMVACWLISILIATLELKLAPDTIGYQFCRKRLWYGKTIGHYGVIFIMWPYGIFCFLLMTFFYVRIVWLVRKHCQMVNTNCRKNHSTTTGNTNDLSNGCDLPSIYGEVCVLDFNNRSLGKRRIEAETARKSLFVIISFVALTAPYPFLVLIEKVFRLPYNKFLYEIQYCSNIMSLMSSVLNPLVYGLANRQFRNAFRKICHRYYRQYKSRDYL